MATLRIQLFGRFTLHRNNQLAHCLEARKVQELFCYLLLHRTQAHAREALAGLLWGEFSGAQAKKSLRQSLWQLQIALDAHDDQPPQARLVLVDAEWIRINTDADFWLDVEVFEQAFAASKGRAGEALDDAIARQLRNAVELYQGDLLAGWYLDWCLYERERLQNMYLAMLDKLMVHCQAIHEFEAGLDYGTRVLQLDRAHERTHRRLMNLYALAGDRSAALRQYERCVTALDEELGVKPSQITTALYQQICADQLMPTPPSQAQDATNGTTGVARLPRALDHLRRLRSTLRSLQQQLQDDIQAVEVALQDEEAPSSKL